MACKHDLTALLPFPTRLPQPVRVEPQVPRLRHRDEPTSRSGLVQLDQLDLTDMVRHHAAARGRGVRNPNPSSVRVERQGSASRRESRSPRIGETGDDRVALCIGQSCPERGDVADSFGLTFGAGLAASGLGVVGIRPVDGRSVEAMRGSSYSRDGAVPSPGFYLDLIGTVTVMALVLLAAILV